MEIAGHKLQPVNGELSSPSQAREAHRTEAAILQIEEAVLRGGGALEPRVKIAIRDFAERVLSTYDGPGYDKILSAATLAGELHAPQGWRLDGIPFVVHPFEVAATLHDTLQIRDPDLICAALLHDTVEDQPKRLAALSGGIRSPWPGRDGDKAEALNVIQDRFGERVAALVDRLTNGDFAAMAMASPEAQRERFPEHRFYQAHVLELYHGTEQIDRDAFAVKTADFLQNLWGINRLRDLGLSEMVEKHEDKRRSLARTISDTVGTIAESHPLYPVRQRVSVLFDEAVLKMASISA